MLVSFRVDSSLKMGTGHVMRCLTLAEELRIRGYECHFICRDHTGNLGSHIQKCGFPVHLMLYQYRPAQEGLPLDSYLTWLGADIETDAGECRSILQRLQCDWLVIDHYGVDIQWESAVRSSVGKIMVIDDLANRRHYCHLMLDQTFGRDESDYIQLVPDDCKLLCGSKYALLRSEFRHWRSDTDTRTKRSSLKRMLITLGGIDADNNTKKVLEALMLSKLPYGVEIIVIMGALAPHLDAVIQQAERMPYKIEVRSNVSNMAEVIVSSDMAIVAAGSTVWEMISLGLKPVLIKTAENQSTVFSILSANLSWRSFPNIVDFQENVADFDFDFVLKADWDMADKIDALGASRVAEAIVNYV